LPKADVVMQIAAAPLAVPGSREAAVAIAVGVQQPARAAASARLADEVEMQVNAYDPDGKLCATRHLNARVTFRSDVQAAARYDMLTRLDLPPGRYQLRVGLQSSLQRKSGSVYYDLDVPDFGALPLALSGVLVTATPGCVAAPQDALASLLPVTPTSSREFGRDQQVTALLRVYQGLPADAAAAGAGGAGSGAARSPKTDPPTLPSNTPGATARPAVAPNTTLGAKAGARSLAPVSMSVTIFGASGAMVFERAPTLGIERFARDRTADCAFDLPMADLQPGPHLLRIEARLGEQTARRDVRFEVRK
jgi:hypothetical protein